VSQAITASQYVPATSSSPGAVSTYTFAAPVSFTLGQVPTTDDVVLSIADFDATGRVVQSRKRLGATSFGAVLPHATSKG
jgi:hypothetical protein